MPAGVSGSGQSKSSRRGNPHRHHGRAFVQKEDIRDDGGNDALHQSKARISQHLSRGLAGALSLTSPAPLASPITHLAANKLSNEPAFAAQICATNNSSIDAIMAGRLPHLTAIGTQRI